MFTKTEKNSLFKKLRSLENSIVHCGGSGGPGSGTGPGDPYFDKLCEIKDAIDNNTDENENNLKCVQTTVCNEDCKPVKCHTCYNVEGDIVKTTHTNVDNSLYTGDVTLLDLDCSKCREVLCDPKVETFQGSNATLTQFNEICVMIPKCCEIAITTNAGIIVIPAQPGSYSFNKKFDCFLTSYSISGDCVDKVTTILTKSF